MAFIHFPNIMIGHASNLNGPTGCTVILCPQGAVAGIDIRGSASGTRQTDSLFSLHRVPQIHGLLFSGGSAFGLDAAGGVMQYLEERGIGFDVQITRVPIVPTAILFDLSLGDPFCRPDKAMGYQACLNALTDEVAEGSVGAGTGATVGKLFGITQATKGGLGYAVVQTQGGLTVAALVVVNAFGDVLDEQGKILAGARTALSDRSFVNTWESFKQGIVPTQFVVQNNTTLGVLLTNARLNSYQARKLAQMGQNALARCIAPVHTLFDGDTIFSLSLGDIEADLNQIGVLGQEMVQEATIRAIRQADGLGLIPAWKD
ncbi:MAG: peptidase, partial [Desulfobacca sp.]|nr:peptidase [Desulfobacca sp.]